MNALAAPTDEPLRDDSTSWADHPGWDRAQALLLLLPAVWLAWPGFPSPIARDFVTTELTATGAAALASLPAAALLAARALGGAGFRLGAATVYLGVLAAALLSALVVTRGEEAVDPLERTRALLWMTTGWIQMLGGASLRSAGRRALVVGAAAVALLLAGPAALESGHAGALHNAGELSNAALPGALAGAALFASGARFERLLGALALCAFLLHALVGTVLAGLATVALIGLGLTASLLARGRDRRALPTFASAGLLAGLGLAWVLIAPSRATEAPRQGTGAPRQGTEAPRQGTEAPRQVEPLLEGAASGDLAGMSVRRRVWGGTAALALDAPVLGVGPGQFALRFPPYRDPLEIELSSHGRAVAQETEVEQPHDEYLLALSEGGLLGALAWAALLAFALRASWRTTRAGDAVGLALSAGVLGLFVAALVNAPFSFNPTASVQGFAFLGALLGGSAARASTRDRLIVVGSCVAFALPASTVALRLVRHGLALASFAEERGASPHSVRSGIDAALAACPSSVTARTLRARFLQETGADSAELVAAWEEVVRIRPHRVEALVQLGALHAQAGELDEARALFEHAATLDPAHPALMRNRARLELFARDRAAAEARLEEAALAERLDALWLRDLGTELLCHGLDLEAELALARSDARFAALDAQRALQLANEYRASGSPRAADGFETQSNRLWGREHAAAGRWDDARRMLRQALRFTRDRVEGGAARIRLELAAAMWRSSRQDEARDGLAGLEIDALDWAAIPEWARAALAEAGFEPPG